MAHSKGAVFIVLWMLLSLLNVLLHMRYNSNFHAPTAPNGCLMKRACVHKYEADGAQTTLFAISVNRILSSVLRMPERSSMYWILRGCGRMWANVGECGGSWSLAAYRTLPITRESRSCEYVPNGEDDPDGWATLATPSIPSIQTPHAPRTETD